MRLYELTAKWRCVAEMAFDEAVEGELPADLMAVIASIEGDIDVKLAACCRIIKETEASQAAFNAEAARLRIKASRCESHVDSLKAYMKSQMETCSFTKREVDSLFTVSIQASPASVRVSDLESVPASWDAPQERKLDMRSIKEAIKAGTEVPGCELVAGTHLRIR